MAKVEMTEREKRWQRVWSEWQATVSDPDNEGASRNAMYKAIGKKVKLSHVTVRKIVERKEAEYGKTA